MQNKGQKNLLKYLSQVSNADDVVNNHAYGKVAKTHRPVPQRRSSTSPTQGAIAGYRDSMVGSTTQYRDTPMQVPERAEKKEVISESVIGNRPKSGAAEITKNDAASIERRHHFIEPPRRGFNRFG